MIPAHYRPGPIRLPVIGYSDDVGHQSDWCPTSSGIGIFGNKFKGNFCVMQDEDWLSWLVSV